MKETSKTLLKYIGKKALKAGIKAGIKMAGAALAAVGWPALVVLCIILSVVIIVGGIYSALPGSGLLTGATASKLDQEYREYAQKTVSEWNVQETWLVDGEGSWYPGEGKEQFGRFADRYGRDAALANTWADGYSPVLVLSSRDEKEDRMEDESWVRDRVKEVAKGIRPWFYYKESQVIYSGPDGSDTETVYLLVEAYTIRGHRQYHYRWVTKSTGNGSVTYEELEREVILDDGMKYLRQFLEGFYDMKEDQDPDLTVNMTWQAMQAFSARKEWLDWLLAEGKTFFRVLSTAAIPPEYMAFLREAEERTGIPVWLLAGLITVESGWNPLAVNDKTGCFGLTQLNPDYWPAWAKRYGFDAEADRLNPRAQILVGAYVLKGYIGGDIDWEADDWKERVKPALARYGGYGSDVEAAGDYISRVLKAASAFSAREATWPVPGYTRITSYFGMRYHPVFDTWKLHTGIDIGAPEGVEVVSVSGGVVAKTGYDDTWGNHVEVQDISHVYLYAHLSRIDVRSGQTVAPGQKLGEVGSTGTSTGPHLHFGVKQLGTAEGWIDPLLVLNY